MIIAFDEFKKIYEKYLNKNIKKTNKKLKKESKMIIENISLMISSLKDIDKNLSLIL